MAVRETTKNAKVAKVRLGDICQVVSGATPKTSVKEYWDGEFAWVTPAELKGEVVVTTTERKLTKAGLDSCSLKLIPQGAVLLTSRAPIGKVAIAGCDMYCNQGFKNLVCSETVHNLYLYYWLKSNGEYLNSLGRGATFKEISKAIVENIKIPLPPLSEQKRIAEELDRICELKKNAEERLALMDQLVKSRFVEVFGSLNEGRYQVKTLAEICEFIKDGTHQTPTYTDDRESGYKFLSSKDVVSGEIDWSRIKYIPRDLHEELYRRISPRRNDILLAKNGTTGVAALVDTDEVFDIYVSLALLRFMPGNDPHYLLAAINSSETKRQFDASLKGVGVPNLHLGEIKKTCIILPPLALQREFAAFVAEVDKSKAVLRETVAQMETLYKAKLHEHFG